jgi:hypothetical protein
MKSLIQEVTNVLKTESSDTLTEKYSSKEIEKAVDKAMESGFWPAIANQFPQIKTGDYQEGSEDDKAKALLAKMVQNWLDFNS